MFPQDFGQRLASRDVGAVVESVGCAANGIVTRDRELGEGEGLDLSRQQRRETKLRRVIEARVIKDPEQRLLEIELTAGGPTAFAAGDMRAEVFANDQFSFDVS